MGKIADILQARGELDEALRIRRRRSCRSTNASATSRSRAVTMGKIADILQSRGEIDEALRIRARSSCRSSNASATSRARAVTMGKIADILQGRGEVDEALRIRREEELPVYERLGDVRGRSATLFKIATALLNTGGLEAGRIQEIYDALAEVFWHPVRNAHPDGIGPSARRLRKSWRWAGIATRRSRSLMRRRRISCARQRRGRRACRSPAGGNPWRWRGRTRNGAGAMTNVSFRRNARSCE